MIKYQIGCWTHLTSHQLTIPSPADRSTELSTQKLNNQTAENPSPQTHTPDLHFEPWGVLSVEPPHPTSACGRGTARTPRPTAGVLPLGGNRTKQTPQPVSSQSASSTERPTNQIYGTTTSTWARTRPQRGTARPSHRVAPAVAPEHRIGQRSAEPRGCRSTYLCRTVEPAARGATALLGERPDVPTLVALGLGPGCGGRREAGLGRNGCKEGSEGKNRRAGSSPDWRQEHRSAEPHHRGGAAYSRSVSRQTQLPTATSLPAMAPRPLEAPPPALRSPGLSPAMPEAAPASFLSSPPAVGPLS